MPKPRTLQKIDELNTNLETINNNVSTSEANIATHTSQIAALSSGSPKAVSLVSQMTDTTKNYVYTGSESGYTSGNWYYYNGSVWISGGIYQATGISDNSIDVRKTNFAYVGKNLFNQNAITDGLMSTTNGTISANANYKTSEFIPIKNGVTYTINNCRNYVLFSGTKLFSSGVDNSSLTSVTFTASADGYLRTTVNTTNLSTHQVEVGSVATAYEQYKVIINALSGSTLSDKTVSGTAIMYDAIDNMNLKRQSVSADKVSFLTFGKNLFDKSKGSFGYLLDSTNRLVTSATYNVSDYIPFMANTNYVINKCRNYAIYDINKTFIGTIDNASLAAATFNKTFDGYVRFSYYVTDIDTTQIELGTVPSTYENYTLSIDKLILTDSQKVSVNSNSDLTVIKKGDLFNIISQFDSANKINVSTSKTGSANGSFNFLQTQIGNDIMSNNNDDITPIRTFCTVGANHGYTCVVEITMTGHGKTVADLGSRWTDGVTTYTLLKIDGNNLYFGCPYTVTNGITSATYIAPVATLIHVSGATNTSNVSISTIVSNPQLYPSTNNKSVKYILDGKEITVDGTYYGTELQVQESYNIIDYKALLDYAQANIGTSYANDNVAGIVKLSINYKFTKGCNCFISHNFKALGKVQIADCGFLQGMIFTLNGYTTKRYMPNVLTKSGYDFKNIVDMTSYSTNLLFYSTDLEDASKLPNRYVDWLYNGLAKKYGFTMGYIIDKTNSKNADRISNIGTGYFWDMRGTKKCYPVAMSNIILNAGDYKTFSGYRNYLAPENIGYATNVSVVEDKKDTYILIDYHQNINGGNAILPKYIGKSITVLESENFTLLNDVVDSDGVTFNIINNYGYAILKLN